MVVFAARRSLESSQVYTSLISHCLLHCLPSSRVFSTGSQPNFFELDVWDMSCGFLIKLARSISLFIHFKPGTSQGVSIRTEMRKCFKMWEASNFKILRPPKSNRYCRLLTAFHHSIISPSSSRGFFSHQSFLCHLRLGRFQVGFLFGRLVLSCVR